ncbi:MULTISPECIES: serine hydrolase domain-containing protein [unclassified Crossiella]|uniref:serine hydrolase domain-containing protein n=1 Tax=unclassified Crossiella TaxID=2620835 RepID=UPI001FFE51B6|nr:MULTISPECIES: serine hydrolase domain-containing protein [unclassified Crossiella]MCK2241284.1 beta-lactamase family protein [Crossiella sp. S99.2]MCK2253572.1 beta-lactamase family protein [Crossiella sp. S99.1]
MVDGYCDPAFTPVRDAFAAGFAAGEDRGAAVSVQVDGRTVVDLWGGSWQRDTVVNLFSVTKGVLAVCAHQLIERGQLDPDAPVIDYWPEFAAAGKSAITVADLLAHRAGLPALRETQPAGALFDWTRMTTALAAETPWWPPGEQHGYHVVTWGWLVGEVLRRASGRTPRELVADLGLDLHLGLPAEQAHRAASTVAAPFTPPAAGAPGSELLAAMGAPGSMAAQAFVNPPDLLTPDLVSDPRWRAAEIPAANGHGNARAVAELYGGLVRTQAPLLGSLAGATEERSAGRDAVLCGHTRFSLGFMLPGELRPFSPGPRAFGHPGAGGALGFADPDARLGFGFTPDRTITTLHGADPRWQRLVPAVYSCL